MALITSMSGIIPELRSYIDQMSKAMSSDMKVTVDTANDTPAATASAWSKTINFRITDSAGNTHKWFSGDVVATVGDTSSAGTATVDDATPPVVNGSGTVVLSGDAASWLAADTATVQFNGIVIMGKTLATVTFTRTFA